jgi:hypothetical protein
MEQIAELDGEIGAISPSGDVVALGDWSASEGLIQLVEVETGEELAPLYGWVGQLGRSMYFSPDGRHLIAETSKGDIPIWDTTTGRLISTRRGEISFGLSIHPTQSRFVSTQSDVVDFEIPTSIELGVGEQSAGTLEFGVGAELGIDTHYAITTSDDVGIALARSNEAGNMLIAFHLEDGEPIAVIDGDRAVAVGEVTFAVVSAGPDLSAETTRQLAIWEPKAGTLTPVDLCSG